MANLNSKKLWTIKKLAIVVPCYNKEEVLRETTKRLTEVLDNLVNERLVAEDSYICYVNDGSSDHTWPVIQELYHANRYVCGINLVGNVGHQNALMAGLSVAVDKCDMSVTIDADLQDDVNAIYMYPRIKLGLITSRYDKARIELIKAKKAVGEKDIELPYPLPFEYKADRTYIPFQHFSPRTFENKHQATFFGVHSIKEEDWKKN